MDYRRFNDTYILRIDRGEEVLETLKALCSKEDIRLAQVDALGAVDHAVVSVYDVPTKTFFKKELDGPMEIAGLTGSVTRKDGEPYLHLHGSLCDRELKAWGGHINALRVSATCEMIIRVIPGEVGRRLDENIGLNLFEF